MTLPTRQGNSPHYKVGQMVRNKHTGVVEPIQEVLDVMSYNEAKEQKEAIKVYVLGNNNRYNMENMTNHWEIVD
jgi:hypothetical protein